MKMEELTAVYHNQFGEIISFQTSGGRIISYRKALAEAEEEKLTGVMISESDNGNKSLSPLKEDNFDHLPSFN